MLPFGREVYGKADFTTLSIRRHGHYPRHQACGHTVAIHLFRLSYQDSQPLIDLGVIGYCTELESSKRVLSGALRAMVRWAEAKVARPNLLARAKRFQAQICVLLLDSYEGRAVGWRRLGRRGFFNPNKKTGKIA